MFDDDDRMTIYLFRFLAAMVTAGPSSTLRSKTIPRGSMPVVILGRAVASFVVDCADGESVQEDLERRSLHLRAPDLIARGRAGVIRGVKEASARFRTLNLLETLGTIMLEALPALALEKAVAVRRGQFNGAVA